MTLDFTLAKYKELCKVISDSEYVSVTLKQYLSGKKSERFIILRHDVDTEIERALKMAQIEKHYCLTSTYFFRNNAVLQPTIITEIVEMGHDVGYHYEVLDKTNGDYKEAIAIFKEELGEFRKITEVKTIAMHGNPRTPYDNLSLWKYYDFRAFDIIGEAYLSIDFNKIAYFSDTSRDWSTKYSVKDFAEPTTSDKISARKTDDIIDLINSGNTDQIYLSVHPARWKDNLGDWTRDIIFQSVKNLGKSILKRKLDLKR